MNSQRPDYLPRAFIVPVNYAPTKIKDWHRQFVDMIDAPLRRVCRPNTGNHDDSAPQPYKAKSHDPGSPKLSPIAVKRTPQSRRVFAPQMELEVDGHAIFKRIFGQI